MDISTIFDTYNFHVIQVLNKHINACCLPHFLKLIWLYHFTNIFPSKIRTILIFIISWKDGWLDLIPEHDLPKPDVRSAWLINYVTWGSSHGITTRSSDQWMNTYRRRGDVLGPQIAAECRRTDATGCWESVITPPNSRSRAMVVIRPR